MIVGVCRISLLLEDCQSVKDRRSVVRRIKDRVTQRYTCAIAEVGDTESCDAAELGFAVVANDRAYVKSMVQKILQFIDDLALAKLVDDEQDYIDYGDGALEGSSSEEYAHFEPDEPSPPKPTGGLVLPARLDEEVYPWDSPEPLASSRTAAHETEKGREEGGS